MPFAYLKDERVRAIRKAFMSQDKEYDAEVRTLIMADIAPEYVQRLRVFESNFNQLAGDLDSLNRRPKLSNGQVPLQLWLQKAIDVVFSGFTEEEIFQQALAEMKTGPADPGESTAIIIEGLDAFIDLIKNNPAAYSAVVFYRKTFETALWEIDVIANYKLLHDALHKVQLNWPESSVVKVLLNQDDLVRRSLLSYSASLNNTCAELRETYENGFVDGAERAWIEELEGYQTSLEKVLNGEIPGIADREPTPEEVEEATKHAFTVIKELLTKKLSQLNNRLKEAINKLHLADLIKAMNDVCEQVTKLSAETLEQIQQYKTGVTELSNLDALLKDLIKQHDAWQTSDTLLRTLGETLKRGLKEGEVRTAIQEAERLANLRFIKAIIENSVAPLLQGKATFWSKRLLSAAEKFSAELERSETDKAEHTFEVYRQQAWNFFFEIDTEMKMRCEELRAIGKKLRKINDQLKFNEDLDL